MTDPTGNREVGPWQKAINKAREAVCFLKIIHPLALNNAEPAYGFGSGTLIDRERGIVITNRHGVGDGPYEGYAVFGSKNYKIDPNYKDPVHDFATIRVLNEDGTVPTDLPDEIVMRPDLARLGEEIILVCNSYGLKNNIAHGYIGRTDSNPPPEKDGIYEDHSTEYIRVKTWSRLGSSGALAVNINGEGIALNCAGDETISFMLPLDLPKKALDCIQQGKPVTRGTVQIRWELVELSQCERYGFPEEWLAQLREKTEYAVCATAVLPEGPGDGKIVPGNILLEIQGELVTSLLQVEMYMDNHVGESVQLKLWSRKDRPLLLVDCPIQDLHALTPHHLVRRSGTVFHNVSCTEALGCGMSVRGIVSACAGLNPFGTYSFIESINGRSTKNLDQLKEILDNKPGDFLVTRQSRMGTYGGSAAKTGHRAAVISDVSLEMVMQPIQGGRWVTKAISKPDSIPPLFRSFSNQDRLQEEELTDFEYDAILPPDCSMPQPVKDVACAMVRFTAHRNIASDAKAEETIHGYGLISDAKAGLILAPSSELTAFDEIIVNVAERINIRAILVLSHPAVTMAILRFDPAAVPAKYLHACSFAVQDPVQRGDSVYHVPFADYLTVTETTVLGTDERGQYGAGSRPISTYLPFSHLVCKLQHVTEGLGVLVNAKGSVAGFMFPGEGYISSHTLHSALEFAQSDRMADMRFRDFDVARIRLSIGFERGLDRRWSDRIKGKHVLSVTRAPQEYFSPTTNTFQAHPLQPGDILLGLGDGDDVVTQAHKLGYHYDAPTLRVLISREGREFRVDAPTRTIYETNTDEVVQFCGAWVQRPCLAAQMAMHPLPSKVHVIGFKNGSPADMELLRSGFIYEVNDEVVHTLTSFVECVAKISFDTLMRIQVKTESGMIHQVNIRKSSLFPTVRWKILPHSPDGSIDVSVVDNDAWQSSLPAGCVVEQSGP